ncbi:MAG TPA: hypothetical protein VKO45_08655 [Methanomicrobiales archaeon]|nr:hypothetical protein [Methanomicrobiales archaeon]
MAKRLRLGRIMFMACAVALIAIIFAGGYLLLSRPAAIYPSIHPVQVEGGTYRNVGMSFRFEGANRSISIPVNGTVYYGARATNKEALLSHDIPDSIFIPAYYLSFLSDPNQEEFFRELSGAFRGLREGTSLDDDESLEMMAVAVQALPYETDGTLTPPKYPIETYTDGTGDCDDKSLLLAGLLAREGYGVALFYFGAETHMAVGIKGYGCEYAGTGYGYVATTNVSLVGVPETNLAGGVNLTSTPLVIPVANGTRLYGACQQTRAIGKALERTGDRAVSLSKDLATLSARMNELRSQGRFGEYNQIAAQYEKAVADFNDNALAHNYILDHQDDRKGTYAWLGARALV